MAPRGRVKLAVVSLGCPKNLVDTERALGQLSGANIAVVDDPRQADWVLINTCGFIQEAKEESINTILEIAELKRDKPSLKIAVAGCLSERYGRELHGDLREADFITGILTRANICELAKAITGRETLSPYGELDDRQRLRLTARHVAYLRISEGCDNRCAYCVIPDIRGGLKSRPFESVIADAAELLADGAVEINVIAQDTTAYGLDLYGKKRLAELLAELARMNPKGWVRLLYAHPRHLDGEMIDVLAGGAPIVPYVDLPLQHINGRLLSSMGRHVTRRQTEDLISLVRKRIPGVYIRTAFIVGFPGETLAEFQELVDFVRSTRFERLGAFTYSREEGSRAAAFSCHVATREAGRRLDALMSVQQNIAVEFNRSLVGKRISGIVDGPSGRDDLPLAGRTYGDAPEVDGTVFISGRTAPGKIVELEITDVEGYDLLAKVARGARGRARS